MSRVSSEGVCLGVGGVFPLFFFLDICVQLGQSTTFMIYRVLGKQNIENSWEWGKAIILLFFVPFLGLL